MIKVVNVIPQSLSGETGQDSEPNIAVNPANPNEIAISAFTPDPMGGTTSPIFVSTDGGNSWTLNSILPSSDSLTGTGDITPRFGGASHFYAGILRRPGTLRLNILRSANFAGPGAMTVLVDRTNVDLPFTEAQLVPSGAGAGNDRVYVGINDLALRATTGRTATVEVSQNAGIAAATFTSARIERRGTGTAGQDGPQVRPAIHPDGTVYAAFSGWRAFSSASLVTTDIVVVRDDNWGAGANPFAALVDPGDGVAGMRVATGQTFTFNGTLAHERLGGDLSIAVDPANSSIVYLAWCSMVSGAYTMHVRRSTDRGVTWSADLKTIANAKNPALAINSTGLVGLAYQRATGTGTTQRWDTHFETTSNAFAASVDLVLATVPSNAPPVAFLPYNGDYIHLMCHGSTFYGVFSANNTPDTANFPQGVTYLRNHDFATHRLLAVNGTTTVAASIDPFFFTFDPKPTFTHLTRLTRFTTFTSLTRLTHFTRFTAVTRLTALTRLTSFTRFTRFTVPRFTHIGPPVPVPDPGPLRGEGAIVPFVRFGNTVFAPEELDLARFEPLEGVLGELAEIGITRLHQLAMVDPQALAAQLGYGRDEAASLVGLAQQLLRGLTQ
jgi:hypothetical protein